jgi:hypothetical protein
MPKLQARGIKPPKATSCCSMSSVKLTSSLPPRFSLD